MSLRALLFSIALSCLACSSDGGDTNGTVDAGTGGTGGTAGVSSGGTWNAGGAANTGGSAGTASDAVKFAPGLWPQGNFLVPYTSDAAGWEGVQGFIDQVGTLEHVTGLQFIITWGVLEKDKGDYTEGDQAIDELVKRMAAIGKPFFIHVWDRKFGGSVPTTPQDSSTRAFPDWLIDEGHVVSDGVHEAAIWRPAVMDYQIALFQHIGTRYNDSRWLHGFETAETSLADIGDFDYEAMHTQYFRLIDEVTPYFPNTGKRLNVNWYGEWGQDGVNRSQQLIAHLYEKGWAVGGPDMYVHVGPTFGEGIVRALGDQGLDDYFGFAIDFGSIDYRGKMGIAFHHEYIHGNANKQDLFDYSLSQLQNTHLTWAVAYSGEQYQDGTPITPEESWEGVSAFLKEQPALAASGCPENLNGACSADWGN